MKAMTEDDAIIAVLSGEVGHRCGMCGTPCDSNGTMISLDEILMYPEHYWIDAYQVLGDCCEQAYYESRDSYLEMYRHE